MNARDHAQPAASVGWRLTRHAEEAAAARGFTLAEVLLACEAPQVAYPGYLPGRMVHQRDRVAVVVCPDSRTVITVLLRSNQPWTDDDARRANACAA